MDGMRTFTTASKRRATRRYLGFITLLVSLVVASSFLGFTIRANALFDTLLLEEGRAFHQELLLVRRWVREHGGVYIRQGGVDTKLKRTVVDSDGEVLLQRNASEVTQELSQLSHESGIIRFGSTTFNPLNPVNKPDAFERDGLERLRAGSKEVYGFDEIDGVLEFRYMSPLVTKPKCVKCHTDGSFQVGRVDSALTSHIPAASIMKEKQVNRMWMAASAISVILLVSISIWLLARRFIRQLTDADRRLERLAAEDALTGLYNRRMGMELLKAEQARCKRKERPLSVALLDIDHFKRINDEMGHLVGDEGLRGLADMIRCQLREYDISFRYGGEEFVVILPETDGPQAMIVAERLRQMVEGSEIETSSGEPLTFTVSIGICQQGTEGELKTLLDHADEALYAAKNSGRNRCVLYSA
ncbi:MAG: diguanylate cyclase [Sedimenticola sp.]